MRRAGDWVVPVSVPPLARGEVHLWRVAVPAEHQIPPRWQNVLTADEQERVARKRIPEDARRTLTSRACLRLLLGDYLGVPPASVALTTSAEGKPALASADSSSALEFNVSHSGDWVVLAFARDLPLGVDIECHREMEFAALVHSFFSRHERELWSRVPADEHMSAFFSAWTRKEAYLKALGVGLSKPLDSFSVAFGSTASSGLVWCADDASAAQYWHIASVDVAPGYACAVALRSGSPTLYTFTFDAFSGRENPRPREEKRNARSFPDSHLNFGLCQPNRG